MASTKLKDKIVYLIASLFLIGVFLLFFKSIWQQDSLKDFAANFQDESDKVKVGNINDGYTVVFSQIKNDKSEIKIGKTNVNEIKNPIEIKNGLATIKSQPQIATEIIYGNENLKFDQAEIQLKKTGPVNAIITCSSFDEENKECDTNWELARDVKLAEAGDNNISFQVKHFSAYVGVYLEILNFESNLTQGDDWAVNFNTFGQSDLIIEATDGTNYPTDISFKNISCGDNPIPDEQIEKNEPPNLKVDVSTKVKQLVAIGKLNVQYWPSLNTLLRRNECLFF